MEAVSVSAIPEGEGSQYEPKWMASAALPSETVDCADQYHRLRWTWALWLRGQGGLCALSRSVRVIVPVF